MVISRRALTVKWLSGCTYTMALSNLINRNRAAHYMASLNRFQSVQFRKVPGLRNYMNIFTVFLQLVGSEYPLILQLLSSLKRYIFGENTNK